MSKLLRYFSPGQFVFVTVVTANRRRILVENVQFLSRAVLRAKRSINFGVIAWVVLPDHVHAIIHASDGETSRILHKVKLSFAMQMQNKQGHLGKVWQHRYWDHILRSQRDLTQHLDYIHFNAVKHGLMSSPIGWPYSSFQRFVRSGFYEIGWGEKESEPDQLEAGE